MQRADAPWRSDAEVPLFFGDAHADSDVVDSGCARFGPHGRCWATAGRFTLLSTTSDAHRRHLQHQWLERPAARAAAFVGADSAGRCLLAGAEVAAERFPQEELRSLGYEAIWQGQQSWNGVAILARAGMPIETRRGLPGDPDDTHSRYLEAEIGG